MATREQAQYLVDQHVLPPLCALLKLGLHRGAVPMVTVVSAQSAVRIQLLIHRRRP